MTLSATWLEDYGMNFINWTLVLEKWEQSINVHRSWFCLEESNSENTAHSASLPLVSETPGVSMHDERIPH